MVMDFDDLLAKAACRLPNLKEKPPKAKPTGGRLSLLHAYRMDLTPKTGVGGKYYLSIDKDAAYLCPYEFCESIGPLPYSSAYYIGFCSSIGVRFTSSDVVLREWDRCDNHIRAHFSNFASDIDTISGSMVFNNAAAIVLILRGNQFQNFITFMKLRHTGLEEFD